MKKHIISNFLFLFTLFPLSNYATHIVGGELNYIYLGNNNYEIRLTMYRDCFNGVPPFDDPAVLGIFDGNNNLVNTYSIPLTTPQILSASPANCLPVIPSNICYQLTTYILNVTLPPISGGYQLSYQRCCRPAMLTNVANVQNTGATYYGTIPDSALGSNNNPLFNNIPFTFLCVNTPFTFDNSAADLDGDSIVYSLTDPFAGGSNAIPVPNPPSNPPYQAINWLSPYSISNIMGGVPLQIDPQTGELSGTPNTTGVFAFNVSAKEFRNGTYIGETRRDFEVYVINNVGVPEVEGSIISCSPNPFLDRTTIKIDGRLNFQNIELTLYNVLGETIRTITNIHSYEIILERNNIKQGLYFYRITSSGKLIGRGRLIAE